MIELNDRDATIAGLTAENPKSVRAALLALDQMKSGNLTEDRVSQLLKSKDQLTVTSAIEIMNRHSKWKAGMAELAGELLGEKQLE